MTIETLRPNAAGDETNITNQEPSEDSHWDKVDEVTADDDTTCVWAGVDWLRDFYNVADSGVGAGTISKITVYARAKASATPTNTSLKIAIKAGTGGGNPDTPAEGSEETITASWANYNNDWITNPATSAAWTWPEINKLQIGVSVKDPKYDLGYNTRVTQVYVEISYTPLPDENIVRIAFDSDPLDDVSVWTDVSSDLISFSTKRGRQHQLDRIEAGTATVLLKNLHGNYWPDNTEGAYYPEVKLGKRVNIRVAYNETVYDEYTGFIRRWNPTWFSREGNLYPGMRLECADLQRNLARAKLNHAGYGVQKSGIRMGSVLTTVGWPVADRDIDTGKENMIATGAMANVNAMEHIFKVQDSELGIFFIRGDGYAVFHERGALEDLESQATFGTGNLPIFDPVFPLDDELLYNEVRLNRESGTEQTHSNAASILAYGLRTLARSGLLLTSDVIVYIYCLYLVARYHDAKMHIKSFTVKPQTPGYETTLWPLVLGLEIGQKITLVWTEASINDDYFIEGIEHSWDYREGVWITKYQCSDAAQFYFEPDSVTEILRPNAAGDETNIMQFEGKPTHWECVEDSGTGTFVRNIYDEWQRDLYNVDALSFPEGTVTKIKVYILCMQQDYSGGLTGWCKCACKSGETAAEGDVESPPVGSWGTYSKEWALSPDTSEAWTMEEIAALQIGVNIHAPRLVENYWIKCMRVWVEVTYIPAW